MEVFGGCELREAVLEGNGSGRELRRGFRTGGLCFLFLAKY